MIGAFGLLAGLWMESRLKDLLEANIVDGLVANAQTASALIGPEMQDPSNLDPLADQLGEAAGVRLTFIDADGSVIGDSEVEEARLAELDNHRGRPEIQRVLAGEVPGVAHRRSATLRLDMLYVAIPHPSGGTIRAARSADSIQQTVWRFRALLAGAVLLGLAGALFMSQLASRLVARDMEILADNTRAMLQGSTPEPLSARGLNELERAVTELATERALFGAVLRSMREAVVAVDSGGLVSLINPAAAALLGLEQDAVGRPLEEVFDDPRVAALAEQGLAGEISSAEIPAPARSLHLLATATPQGGGGCVMVLYDVTEIQKLERVRRDFVTNVSHELRTPVTILRTCAEALEGGALEDPTHAERFVRSILNNTERMGALVNDLLDLSRIESGQIDVTLQPVDLYAVSRQILESIAPRADARELILRVEEGIRVQADARALDHLLTNLLENAIKYTDDGGRIELRAKQMGTHVRIEVRDDGPGIPEEHRSRVFERFYRVDSGRSRKIGGTGLGLAIVKHLAESMGGQVGVRAWKPRGSVFWVILRVP